jgi:hypothetical protein
MTNPVVKAIADGASEWDHYEFDPEYDYTEIAERIFQVVAEAMATLHPEQIKELIAEPYRALHR